MTGPNRFRDLEGRDAYEILGVPPTATRQEIGKARRERQRTAHPDRVGSASDDLAKLINRAADILLDEPTRRDYDLWRQEPAPKPERPHTPRRPFVRDDARESPSASMWDNAAPGFTPGPPPKAQAQPQSMWDEADRGFTAPQPPPAPNPRSAFRGTGPPPGTTPPRPNPGHMPGHVPGHMPGHMPGPGPGPGPAPMYGSPNVMPHAGQTPPQYYHEPSAPKSGAGRIGLIVSAVIFAVCVGFCFLNSLLQR